MVVCCVIVLGLVGVFARGVVFRWCFRVWFIVVLFVGWGFVCLVQCVWVW